MGKPTGFMEYDRQTAKEEAPKERIKNFKEFHTPLSQEEQRKQGARCMACGVPFCQSGMDILGMTSGCPLHNLVPEWNDLIYTGNWEQAYSRLKKTNNFPEFTARVCPALCEAACTCSHYGDAVSVKENELLNIPMNRGIPRQSHQRYAPEKRWLWLALVRQDLRQQTSSTSAGIR